jgi:UDP-2-acetamido-3-amino-2,3-dideoxy-glucuronate N-acetyltransferase
MANTDPFIHPSSIVETGAQIGKGTRIWHFCHLMPGAKLGNNCTIGQNVYIDNDVEIGNGVKIQNNVSVYTGVMIEDDVFLGPSVVFTNVINPRSFINRKEEFRKTWVRKGASVGANATLLCGLEIGAYSMIGAGALIAKDVKPYAVMAGNPAQQIGWISQSGMSLVFDEKGMAICSFDGKKYSLKNDLVEPLE